MIKRLNNKAFTLIELLAVIIILGILMIIAIPQITKYITNSKKDTFAETALSYINSARYSILNDEYDQPLPSAAGEYVCIKFTDIDVEKGKTSPFGGDIKKENSYVKVKYADGKVKYSVFMIDDKGYSTGGEKEEYTLNEKNTKRSIKKDSATSNCFESNTASWASKQS